MSCSISWKEGTLKMWKMKGTEIMADVNVPHIFFYRCKKLYKGDTSPLSRLQRKRLRNHSCSPLSWAPACLPVRTARLSRPPRSTTCSSKARPAARRRSPGISLLRDLQRRCRDPAPPGALAGGRPRRPSAPPGSRTQNGALWASRPVTAGTGPPPPGGGVA
ncbi:hypothetical protein KIL84_000982 [Mauremys mutica]|uniref:Uncharacterized protein n=1 Tax=Mauremys mutica TaxID=74926 RepID=A0A9D3WZL2_9SAUR|nr:hypothetical protein KIL84_000982 [Mauremys mutica]